MADKTATMVATIADTLKEELNPTVIDMLPASDPVYDKIITTSQGVVRKGIGRAYSIKQVFSLGLAGGFKWVNPLGGTVNQGGNDATAENTTHAHVLGDQIGFPGVGESAWAGTMTATFTMSEGFGNFFLPKKVLEADELDASIASIIQLQIKNTARLVGQQNAIAFYKPTNGSIGVVDETNTSITGLGSARVTLAIDGGRLRYFRPGMFVDVYDSTLATHRNASYDLMVDYVDYLATNSGGADDGAQLKLVVPSGSDIPASGTYAIADNDVIFPKDPTISGGSVTRRMPFGLDDWIKSSGTLFESGSGLDTAVYPEFKSIVTALSASLTEDRLTFYLGRYIDAYEADGLMLDTIITTRGVTQEYLDKPKWSLGAGNTLGAGNFTMERQGKAVDLKGGWVAVGYVYDGRPFQWLISPYCQAETLYAIKLGDNNMKRYVPPSLPGAGSQSQFSGDVKFFAPAAGMSGIFMPVTASGGAVSPMVQAPFSLMYQIIPTECRSIKLTSVTEQT